MLGLAVAGVVATATSSGWIDHSPSVAHGLGYAAGFTSGIGFHYRQFREDGWGWGATAAAGIAPADGEGAASLGLEAFRTIFLVDWGRFYWVAAIGHHRQITRGRAPQSFTNLGAGLGIAFGPANGVNLAIEVPYTLFFDTDLVFRNAFPAPNAVVTYQF